MTRDETKKIIMIISATYPNWKPQNMSFTVDAWNMMLEPYNYTEIAVALKAFITTDGSGFAPSVGQLISLLDMRNQQNELNEMEAWALVSKALRNGYYGAEQEFVKLSETVQKAVGSPDNLRNWSQTDCASVENVIQSNFMRSYRTVLKREQELRKMPDSVRKLLVGTCEKMEIEQKAEEIK